MTRDELKTTLRTNHATVIFEKADGTLRTMRCSLKSEDLPEAIMKESTRVENLDVLAVWDLDAGGWRSFRIDSIKSIEVSA